MGDFDRKPPRHDYESDAELPLRSVNAAPPAATPIWSPDSPSPLASTGALPGLFTSAGIDESSPRTHNEGRSALSPGPVESAEDAKTNAPGLLDKIGALPVEAEAWATSKMFSLPSAPPNGDEEKLLAHGGQFTGDNSPTWLQSVPDIKTHGLPPLTDVVHDFAGRAESRSESYEGKGIPPLFAGALGTVDIGIQDTVADMSSHIRASSNNLERALEDPAPSDKLVDGSEALLHLGAGALDAFSIADPVAGFADGLLPITGAPGRAATATAEAAFDGSSLTASPGPALDSALESHQLGDGLEGSEAEQGGSSSDATNRAQHERYKSELGRQSESVKTAAPANDIEPPKQQTGYFPTDQQGDPIALPQQRYRDQDLPLPDPAAEGSAHTTLGGRVGGDGNVYRQSAEFPGGTWPKANGQDVPWSRVDWTDHDYLPGDPHANPHEHTITYDSGLTGRGWSVGKAKPVGR